MGLVIDYRSLARAI